MLFALVFIVTRSKPLAQTLLRQLVCPSYSLIVFLLSVCSSWRWWAWGAGLSQFLTKGNMSMGYFFCILVLWGFRVHKRENSIGKVGTTLGLPIKDKSPSLEIYWIWTNNQSGNSPHPPTYSIAFPSSLKGSSAFNNCAKCEWVFQPRRMVAVFCVFAIASKI
jgi:hypothetical protein